MEEQEILEIQTISDDDLLTLHDRLVDHISYLKDHILDTTIPESEETSDEQQQS